MILLRGENPHSHKSSGAQRYGGKGGRRFLDDPNLFLIFSSRLGIFIGGFKNRLQRLNSPYHFYYELQLDASIIGYTFQTELFLFSSLFDQSIKLYVNG